MGDDPTELAGLAGAHTESVHAWSLADDDALDDFPTRRLNPRRVTWAAVAASVAVIALAAGVSLYVLRPASVPAEPATTATTTPAIDSVELAAPPPAVPSPPVAPPPPPPPELSGVDGAFVTEMRGFGVPVSDADPQWTVDFARAVCGSARENPVKYPPGTDTLINLTSGVMENNPGWTRQQATRFTNSAVAYFCPDVRGPSQQEIAALPPDARYLALLQDRIGITPVDNTLIAAGQEICIWKSHGWWTEKITDAMTSPNPPEDERVIVDTAVEVYCPQFG